MKKLFGLTLLLGLIFGINAISFAQDGQNPPPQGGKMGKRGDRGPGGDERGGPRGMRGGMMGGPERGGPRGGMHGGFGISDDELFKLNLTDAQKIKLFDFKKKMFTEHEAMMKAHAPQEKPANAPSREEMQQLMSAKQLGTLTADQKTKLDSFEAARKANMDKHKAEMDQMQTKMEAVHKEYLSIFTADQIKQLEQIRADKFKAMNEMRKNAPPKGQPKADN